MAAMRKPASVFISSTSEDLKEYRLAARDAVLEVGLRPEMMEYFAAGGAPPLSECLARVSPCDLVVVLVARRYGWVPADQIDQAAKSITWLECEHAAQLGRDLLVFILDQNAPWPVQQTEAFRLTDAFNKGSFTSDLPSEVERNVAKLGEFRQWLEAAQIRATFTNPDDLRAKVILALYKWLDTHPARVPSHVDELSELGGLSLDGYKIFQGLALNKYSNGVDGFLLILIDERIDGLSGAMTKDAYSGVGTLYVKLDPQNWSLRRGEVKQALLLVVDEHRRILYSEQLGRESARLDRVFLYRDKRLPTFIVTRDYSIGWGSYNGPISYFLEVFETGIHYILPHGLMMSLKTAWVIDNHEPAAAILTKKCRPSFGKWNGDSMEFQVIHERFSFDGEHWNAELHKEIGFWEDEGDLDPEEFRRQFGK
jgi:hypothetical protein